MVVSMCLMMTVLICAGKLLERSQKIAYNLNKLGSKGDGAVSPGDRVSDVYYFVGHI